jgi:catalase
MVTTRILAALAAGANVVYAQCPYMANDARDLPASHPPVRRDEAASTNEFMAQYEIDDSDVYLTSDVGGPIEDQESLSVGERGPTLLEDFIFRQKVSALPRKVHKSGTLMGRGGLGVIGSMAPLTVLLCPHQVDLPMGP